MIVNQLGFKTLGLLVESSIFELWDDGVVENTVEHTKRVYQEVMGTNQGLEDYLARHCSKPGRGACMEVIYPGAGTLYVIFYESVDPITDTFNSAHEETHVLHAIGELDLLQKELRRLGVNLDLGRYVDPSQCDVDDKERVACIGGTFALHRDGADIGNIPLELHRSHRRKALAMYQEALS